MNDTHGFILVSVLLVILLAAGLGILIHQQVAATVDTGQAAELELKALAMAQNGIRVARSVLASTTAADLLAGPDGTSNCPGLRNPVSFEAARTLDPDRWTTPCDDGFPNRYQRFQPVGRSGYFLFRFSNNPEEGSSGDRDGILLVRSLGLVPDRRCRPPRCSHHLALVEARFRKEYAFAVDAPLALVGSALDLVWAEQRLPFAGSGPWFTVVETGPSTLMRDVAAALEAAFPDGTDVPRLVTEATEQFQEDPNRRRILLPEYWAALSAQLARLKNPPAPAVARGLHVLEEGGRLVGDYSGVLFSRGSLTLSSSVRFTGLLIHLGSGTLTLETGARVAGAIWMANVGTPLNPSGGGRLQLMLDPGAEIRFDGPQLEEALSLLPPTLLGWRIIFPEME